MGILATATVDIVPNLKPLTQGLRQARAELDKFARTGGGGAAGLGMFALGTGLAASIAGAVKKSADLAEIMNKVKVTFGTSGSSGVIAQANELADKFGLVKKSTLDAAANFGLFGQAAGYSKEQSAEFAKQLVMLGADLASFHDMTREAAFEKLESGLTGQVRPLREIGIFLSADAVKARALAMGLGQVGRELTDQEKIRARFSLIVEQAGPARGDLERTASSTHNQLLKAQGDLENFITQMGTDFEPALLSAINLARELGTTLQKAFAGPEGKGLVSEAAADLKKATDELRDMQTILARDWTLAEKLTGIFRVLLHGEGYVPGVFSDLMRNAEKPSKTPEEKEAATRARQMAGTMADIEAARMRAALPTLKDLAEAEINEKSAQDRHLEKSQQTLRAHMRRIQSEADERLYENYTKQFGVEGGPRGSLGQTVLANKLLERIRAGTPGALNVMRNVLGGPIAPLMGAGTGGTALATGLGRIFGGPKPPEVQAYQDQIDQLKDDLKQEKRIKEAKQRLGISDQPSAMFADPADYARSMVQGILGQTNDQVKAIEDSIRVLEEIRDKLPGQEKPGPRRGIFPLN